MWFLESKCNIGFQAFLNRNQEIFKIDDVFVTAILAKEANVTHKQLAHHVADMGDTETMLTGPIA